MDFEQAKAEWLKKLGGKSLEEYEEDKDRKALEAAEKMGESPEVKAIWEKAEEEPDDGDDD